MTRLQLGLIILTVLALSCGQVLFKLASSTMDASKGMLFGFILNPWLIAALFVYGTSTIGWLYILKMVPLRTAYPFMALAFLTVPLLAHFLLNEPLKLSTFVSAICIIIGVWVSTLAF